MDSETLILLRNFSTLFLELVTAVIGSLYYHKYKDSLLKYFIFYLWFVVFVEYLGYFHGKYFAQGSNHLLYNIFYIISFGYLFFLYGSILKKKKKIVKYSYIVYIITFTVYGFFTDYLTEFQTIPYVVGASLLILAIIFYFTEILATEKVLHTKKNLLFWISVGLLLFYVGSIPFTITINYYAQIKEGISFLFAINYCLIIILNLCYIIGFIWSNKKQLY